MIVQPTRSTDIVLTFAWDDGFERAYASWQREVRAAERVHRSAADRLSRRNAVLAVLLVMTTLLLAAGAIASPRIEAFLGRTSGIDADVVSFAIGGMAALAALLALVQALGRFASRAETHRLASIRYGSLAREMATTLATPRAARVEPDRALNSARERMDRYAERSPSARRRLWRTVGAEIGEDRTGRDPAHTRAPFAVGVAGT
jgi:hypothetical protein